MLLTLDEGYLLTAALPDLQRGIAPLGPPVPVQPGRGISPLGCPPDLGCGGSSSRPLLRRCSLALWVAAPDLGRAVAPLGCALVRPSPPPAL